LTYLITIIVFIVVAWFAVGFLQKREAKKKAEQQAAWDKEIHESRAKSREAELQYRLYQKQLTEKPAVTTTTTRTYVGEHGHVVNHTTFGTQTDEQVIKKISSSNALNQKYVGKTKNPRKTSFVGSSSNPPRYEDDSLLNTVLATAVLNDAFTSNDSRSEPDTFSGGGGSFGGGGSSGSWDNDSSSSSSSSSYDSGSSGGGFDSGSSGSFGSD
jgi:uncharacterized membrane protein YgcG